LNFWDKVEGFVPFTNMADSDFIYGDAAQSPSRFPDQSTAPHGILSAEQGRVLIDEVEDPDIQAHGKLLNELLLRTYSSSQTSLIGIKKRLIEEKEIALLEADRNYRSHCCALQDEIRELRDSLEDSAANLSRQQSDFALLSDAAASLVARRTAKYSAPASLHRTFCAWAEEVRSQRRADKLDLVAKAFARKYILAKAFLSMCLSSQKRKSGKASAEAKFKFDSVTNDVSMIAHSIAPLMTLFNFDLLQRTHNPQMVKSYESQLQALREDLKEAYITIEAEQLRRQQLEEDLRRLFLKNMTAMNFEALSLFQNSHNMVESVHTKPIRSPVPAATPPQPVRRDLAAPSSVGSSAVKRNDHSANQHNQRHHGPSNVMKSSLHGLSGDEITFQARLDSIMQAGAHNDLQAPHVTAPPAAARAPQHPHRDHDAHLRDSYEPRSPFYGAPSPGSTNDNGCSSSPARYTHQLTEAYRSATSVTSRLAHNATPGSAGTGRNRSPSASVPSPPAHGGPPHDPQHHHAAQHQQHQAPPVSGSFSRRSPSQSPADAVTQHGNQVQNGYHHYGRAVAATNTPASSAKKPFH
jgi:hypothetical protein